MPGKLSVMQKNKNTNQKKVFRVGIDARFFGLENKGLGRYTNELIEGLDKILPADSSAEKNIEYFIFLKKDKIDKYHPQSKRIRKVPADFRWYSWSEQIRFPLLLNKHNLDLVHFPHFNVPFLYRRKFVVTIHDLILFHYPTLKNTTLSKIKYLIKLTAYHFLIRQIGHRASKIIAISAFTKKDLVKTLKVPAKKIVVVSEGAEFGGNKAEKRKKKRCDDILKKYGIIKPYLLYVGNAYPHKNLERLLLAFQSIQRNLPKDYQLVLVGKKDYFYQRLKKFIRERKIKRVVITDYISDKELTCVYEQGRLFVFPSLYEGFGLPPLEALLKGLPVISSDKSSLPEILGDKVIYFNPERTKEIERALSKVLQNPEKGIYLSEAEKRALRNKYSWEKMVKELENIYQQQLNEQLND
jgi:glycosyltransferase involved in cell wall biosynthesis